jgi:hypothetical protein
MTMPVSVLVHRETIMILTPWRWALLEKPLVAQLLHNSQIFYVNRSFMTAFTTAHHRSLSRARWIQSISTPSSFSKIHFKITLAPTSRSSYWSLSSWIPHQNLHAFLSVHIRAIYPTHLILLDFILILFGEGYKLWSWSQWPRRLRNKLSSPARTLQSWVRIPLEAWMSVYVYSVLVLFCV